MVRYHIGAFYSTLRQDVAELTDGYDDRDLALIVDYLTRANDILRDASNAVAGATQAQPSARAASDSTGGHDGPLTAR